jgi:hypothetical protein
MSLRPVVALLAAALLPVSMGAQDLELATAAGEALVASVVSAGSPRSCIDALPKTAFRRTMVFLTVDHAGEPFERIPGEATLAVRLAMESIAWHARALLGAPEGLLPPADTLVDWRSVGRHLHLVGHKDGRITWSYPWDTPGHRPVRDSVGEPTLALLGRAIDTALARNERFPWADEIDGDSVPFLLRVDYPELDDKGQLEPMRALHAAALLEIRVPMLTPVEQHRMSRILYPETLRRMGVTGKLVLQFVVDTSGRPIGSSIRDVWPEQRPRLRGDLQRYYTDFLDEAKRGVQRSVYRPARVGGCPIAQLVQQPFIFDISR